VAATSPASALRALNGWQLYAVTEQVFLVTVTTPAPWIAGLSAALGGSRIGIAPTGRAARKAVTRGPLRDFQRFEPAEGDWVRWDLPSAGYQLDHAYMPARLEPPAPVVALPGRSEADSPAMLWLEIAHPHTAARIRTAPDRDALVAELLTGVRARFIIGFSARGLPRADVAVATDHPIAAQLVWRAAQRIAEWQAGLESMTPWEDGVVQAAAQLGFGPAFGAQLTVHVSAPDQLNLAVAEALQELLDCAVMSSKGADGGR
jgi:hypothetical protein